MPSECGALGVETLEAIALLATDAIFVTDEDLRVTWVNAAACAALGYSADELAGRRIAELLDWEAPQQPLQIEALRAGNLTHTTRIFKTKAGARVHLEVRARAMGGGRLLGIARDVTERVLAMDRLERSEKMFRTLAEASPDGIVIHREGRVVYANRAAGQMLGIRPEEAVGQSVLDRIHPDDRAKASARLAALQGDVESVPFTDERLLAAGGRVVIASVGAIRLDFEGRPSVVALVRDVTEQRRMHEQLAQSERMASLGTLAAGIAHEINNPLTYVLLHLGALRSSARAVGGPAGKELEERISAAVEGAERVASIVRDLRVFSRGDVEPSVPVDVHRPIEVALGTAAHELRPRARVVRDFGRVPCVAASEGRLAQVVLNLVVNAAQAIPEGRPDEHEVRVQTRHEAGEVLIHVSDTGVGIPPENRARIFEPFFSTKRSADGSGLGLAICHGLVTSMGGRISVESTVGVGSRFTVHLVATEDEQRG